MFFILWNMEFTEITYLQLYKENSMRQLFVLLGFVITIMSVLMLINNRNTKVGNAQSCGFIFGCSLPQNDKKILSSVNLSRGDLLISENKRYIVHADGTPFFYLGDTAWELFHRLNREEADRYLSNRQSKRFTVIQAVALAELDGLNSPNAYGDRPLKNNDPLQPDVTAGSDPDDPVAHDYWDHMDWIIDKAAQKGIYIGFLPTWGDKVVKKWGVGPVVITADNAYGYGEWLGKRYKNKPNIIWILGGDRPAEDEGVDYRPVFRRIAEGIKSADTRHLITYHPMGGNSSSTWFPDEQWLDFHMCQSGHHMKDNPNYEMVAKDYSLSPEKPCFDGEPRYEDHPVNWNPDNGWFDDYDVRQGAYWAIFAGGFGHTYGNHNIWQMMAPGRQPISSARHTWFDTMDLAGAYDMQHVRALIESRPFLDRVPDQTLIAGDAGRGMEHVQATRGQNYAFLYIPTGKKIMVQMGKISGEKVKAWWFDPREGKAQLIGYFQNTGIIEFTPSGQVGRGNDWVLVIDDANSSFTDPGKIK
jgi:hypothetical protein